MSAARSGGGLARKPSILGTFLRYWLPVLAFVTLIFALSSVANLKPPLDWANSDKLAHGLEYTVLGFLLVRAFDGSETLASRFACAMLAVIVGCVTGTLDELWQAHVPGRVSSPYDFLADATGIVIGQIVYALWSARGR